MTFGMLLLAAVIGFSFAGSMIPQQRPAMEYVSRYGATVGGLIIRLGLDDVFATPVFLLLMAALALNLTLCSVVRVRRLRTRTTEQSVRLSASAAINAMNTGVANTSSRPRRTIHSPAVAP